MGSKEHTYDYLLDCMDRYLRRTGVQQNQQEHEKIFELQMKALKDGKNLTPAQLAQQLNVVPAKGGKGDGKYPKGGKGKGRDEQRGGAQNRNQSPAAGAQVCWYHNAKHHYPDGGFSCASKLDETTGRTSCWFPHTIVSRKDFDAMTAPRSAGKGGGKGGKAGGKDPKGGRRDDRSPSPSPGGEPKYCFEFAKSGTCKNGDGCWFGHVSPSEAKKMGFLPPPPKGGKEGKKGDRGKNVAAAEQQSATVAAAPRNPGNAVSAVVAQIQQHQDEAADAFAAAHMQ